MGLMPVFYNSNNSKPAKQRKFRSAEEKRSFEMAKSSEYGIAGKIEKRKFNTTIGFPNLKPPVGRETPHYPSRDTGGGIAARAPDKVYTGTMIKGIGTMHKSNAVPIFSDEEAVDIAKMRRG
jgi:hypothetical protein